MDSAIRRAKARKNAWTLQEKNNFEKKKVEKKVLTANIDAMYTKLL